MWGAVPPRGLSRACLPGRRGLAANQLEKVGGAATPAHRALAGRGAGAQQRAAALEAAGRARPVKGP